ncbi:MAG TPA: glycosyltransferase [Moheibacter sp.]|nr:glycosyltransferase [Moheibacter sp.]
MLSSLLIAHFNNWEYFQDCYKSIQNQTYRNFEIVVLDDCSTDGSFQQLQALALKDSNIKLFKNETNQGVGFTKAKLIELAKGEVIGFLDPDDTLYESALELSINEHVKNEKIVATYSQIMLCDENLNSLRIYTRTRKIKNNNQLFFNINNEVSHFFTFKKKAYLKTNGINPELTSSVDFDLYLKLYEIGEFTYIDEPLYYYRQHQKGVSQNIKKKDSVKKNWNKVLYDTCLRRKIDKIGKTKVSENIDLSKLIFERENSLFEKIKRKLF